MASIRCGWTGSSAIVLAAVGLACAGSVRAQALVNSTVSASTPDNPADPNAPQKVGADVAFAPPPSGRLQVKAGVGLQAGDRADPAVAWPGGASPTALQTPWSRLDASVLAGWTATPRARLDVSVDRALEMQAVPPRPDGSPARDSRDSSTADVKLDVAPTSKLALDVSGRASDGFEQVVSPYGSSAPVALHTVETTADASARWTLNRRLSLEADDRVGVGDASLRETGTTNEGYAVSEPRVSASLTPWAGAQWRLSFGHEVSALDLSAFATVAENLQRASDLDAGTGLQPNQEWRTQAELKQTLPGSGSLGLILTSARLDTTQELIRNVDGTDLPGSITGGERRQVDVAATIPLGAGGFSLQTDASARASQITDPVTGAARRLSGEAPYDARLTLVQDIAPLGLKWGVQASAQGQQVYYTPEEASTAAQDHALGMFVEYRPKPFALRLQVDGLAGGQRDITDVYYDDTRESGLVGHIDHRLDGGPAVSLVLKKAL